MNLYGNKVIFDFLASMISILYVDDEPDLLEIAKLFLEQTGQFSVDTCASPLKAREILATSRYDAIISDYQMPGMDGIEFLKYVRLHHGGIPFILFTGRGREEVVIQALDNGADFYLQKGGDPKSQFAELRNKIEKAVKEQQAVAAQRDTEHQLADIINFLPDATLAIDIHGTVIAWNRAMEQMTGVSAGSIIGKGNYEYALPFYRERRPILLDLILNYDNSIADIYDTIKRDGSNLISEKFIPFMNHGNGAYLWFIASPFYDASGNCVGAIESIRDITVPKKMEASLRASERQYHNVFESAAEALIVVDRDSGEILDANKAATKLYGYTHDEFKTLQSRDLTQDHERMINLYGEGILHIPERQHRKKDGSLFPAEITGNVYPQKKRTIAIITVRDITERKKAGDALRDSETRFRALIENASDIIRILDRGGRIVFDTSASERMLGYPPGYTIGRSPLEYIHPDDLEKVRGDLSYVYDRTNTGVPTEFRIRKADGSYAWVESSAKNLIGVPGIDGIVTTTRFIDEEKKAEEAMLKSAEELHAAYEELTATEEELRHNMEDLSRSERALRKSEEKFHSLYDHMIEGAALHKIIYNEQGDPEDYVIIETNPAFEKQLGLSHDTVLGKTSREAYGVAEPPNLEIYTRVALTGEQAVIETYFAPLKKYFSISVYCPYKGSFATIFEDITGRKKAEEELLKKNEDLRASYDELSASEAKLIHTIGELTCQEKELRERERFLTTLISNLPGFAYRCKNDPEWTMEYMSEGCRNITGYAPEDFLGNKTLAYNDIIHPEFEKHIWDAWQNAIMKRETFVEEYPIITRTGESRWVWERGQGVFSDDGILLYLEGFITDITGHKKAEETLLHMNRNLSLLSGITRHDINNQIVILNGFLEILRIKAANPALEEYFTRIKNTSSRISRMITFTREYESIGLNAPVWQNCRTLVDAASKEATLGKVIVKNDLPGGTEVFADPLIVRVCYNLMDNALRYGNNLTTIRFSFQERDGDQIFICEDDGEGIPTEEKEKIFEHGYGKNTGLGLAISREILSITGLTIKETGEPGKGARFEITVPGGMYRIARDTH